jgi:hypothetical protein
MDSAAVAHRKRRHLIGAYGRAPTAPLRVIDLRIVCACAKHWHILGIAAERNEPRSSASRD